MKSYGKIARFLAPRLLLVGPALYTFDQPTPGLSILGAICMGIALSASYMVLEQIAESLRTKRQGSDA